MESEVKKEIDDMLKGLSGGSEPPIEEPPIETPPVETPPKEEPPKEDPPIEEPPIETPPKEEPLVDDKDKIIEDLRLKLAEREKVKEKDKEPEKPKEPEPLPDLTPEAQDFIGDLDLDDLVRDKELFNKVLNTIYTKGLNESRKVVGEGILRGIPDIVKANIEIVTKLKETSDKFYTDNEDLKPFKKVVAAVFEEVASQNPDKKYSELLEEVGTETRKRLDLHKKAVEKKEDKPPNLPQKKGSGGDKHEKPNTSPLQDEIEAMNKTLLGGN